jgi:CheY-like chemotaxis protein
MQSALSRSLIAATVVHTGEAALARLTTEPYDLLLLDIALPGISGLEVCRQMKGSPPLRDIPVIFISGQGTPENKAEAQRLGAADFIEKPFGLLPFLSCVMGHLKLGASGLRNARQAWPVAMP